MLSIGNSLISAISTAQDSDPLWNHKRGAGARIDPLTIHDVPNSEVTKYDQVNNHWIKFGHLGYISGFIVILGLIILAFNRWCCCTIRRSRRNRAVGRLQRVIQAIATRKMPTI